MSDLVCCFSASITKVEHNPAKNIPLLAYHLTKIHDQIIATLRQMLLMALAGFNYLR
jgi:hypothetical protein